MANTLRSSAVRRPRWRAPLVPALCALAAACGPADGSDAGTRDLARPDALVWVDGGSDGPQPDAARDAALVDTALQDRGPADAPADVGLPGDAAPGERADGATPDASAATDADGATDGGTMPIQGQALLQGEGRAVLLHVLEPGVLRVHHVSGTSQHERGWTTTIGTWPTAALPVVEQADRWLLDTGWLRATVFKADLGVEVVDRDGHLLWRSLAVDTASTPRRLDSEVLAGDHFFGLGEKTGPLDKRGQRLEMWTTDPWFPEPNFSPSSDPIYQAHPFVLTLRQGRAHGLYLLNTHRSRFDLAATDASRWRLEVDGGDLDLVLLAGPGMAEVLARYTALTGRSPLPPLWTLGYHQCRWSYAPAAEVRAVVDEFARRDLPLDGIWLDIDYMDGFRSFTWDPVGFADPAGLVADLLAQGVKTTVIIDPGIKHQPAGGYAAYDSGIAGGHFVTLPSGEVYLGSVWPGDAVFPDFTRPATRAWWAGQVEELLATGVRGIWIDMNEPTTWQEGGFPLDSRFDGEGVPTDHREARNVYALLMARATRQGMLQAAPGRRPFVLTRAGFAGIQREAAVWTGDAKSEWGHLAMAPAMLGNLGLSGVPLVGSDVGGFSGSPGPELFARWMALGSVSPFFRAHVMTGAPRQEPWSFGVEVEAISRALIRQRYELLPYLYALVHEAAASGAPPLRPVVFDFQTDPVAPGLDDELMLGPELLVAPVVAQGHSARAVHLPDGAWVEWDSGRRHPGGRTVDVAAPLYRLPLLARANAAIPLWPPRRHVDDGAPTPLYLELFPVPEQPPRQGQVVLDDGEAVSGGEPFRQAFGLSATASGATLVLEPEAGGFAPAHDALWLRVRGVSASPTGVHLDGAVLPQVATTDALATTSGWLHDARAQVVHVRIPRQPAGAVVDLAADLAVQAPRRVALTLRVALPASTPAGDTVYLASDVGGWAPDGLAMVRDGAWAVTTLEVDEGQRLQFKFTRGAWAGVEVGAACEELANRELVVIGDRDGRRLHVTEVARWRGVDCS